MVLSLINPVVNYVEDSKIKKEDKSYAATVYETEIQDNYVPIALGKQRSTENLVYYPIYLVSEKPDGKTKLTQIGVYEMLAIDLKSLLDEDGDLEIDQLTPLLYSSYKREEQKEEQREEEQREVIEIIEDTNNQMEQSSPVWLNDVLGNKHRYEIPENEGAGDCLFIALRDALESKGRMVSVKDLRLMLAKAATENVYKEYLNMYTMFADMLTDTNKRIEEIAQKNEQLKTALTKETLKEKQKKIVEMAKQLKKEFITLKDEKKTSTSYLRDYAFMKGVDSFEKFKNVLLKKKFWADSWALATLEEVLNIKFIILSKESYEDDDDANIMRCGEMTPGLEEKTQFTPDFYVVVEKSFNHYRLIVVDGKKALNENEIPQEILALIKNKCLESMSGTFALIPFFRELVSVDKQEKREKNKNNKNNKNKNINKKEETVNINIDALYDPNIRFVFYHKSAARPLPGRGSGEKVPKENVADFVELSKIKDWRRKLDRTWVQKFEAEGRDWASVEHFYQAGKFKESSPDFYEQFSLDSGSELSQDPFMAKGAGGVSGKYKGLKIRPEEVGAPMAFFGQQQVERMRAGHRAKYQQNPDLKAMLLATKQAELAHFRHKQPLETYEVLMEVRKDLAQN